MAIAVHDGSCGVLLINPYLETRAQLHPGMRNEAQPCFQDGLLREPPGPLIPPNRRRRIPGSREPKGREARPGFERVQDLDTGHCDNRMD